MLLNIDFEKAFDSIEWDFVMTALKTFGFPPRYISYIETLYNDISSCVINNGNFTEFFKLYRGVRQGCPLSPYLFVISAEILSLYIKEKSLIEGILYNNHNFIVSQFADDTSLAVKGTEENVKNLFSILSDFEEVSGLKVNVNKTEALMLGPLNKSLCKNLKINWVEKSTRVLGIHITKDAKSLIDINYDGLIERIAARLQNWKRRNLSLLGRINIIKCLGISQVIFLFSTLGSPGTEFGTITIQLHLGQR